MLVHFQKLSKTIQNLPKISKTCQNFPKLSKTFQNYPKLSKTIQSYPNLPKTIQGYPKLSKTIPNFLKLSKPIPNYPKLLTEIAAILGKNITDFNDSGLINENISGTFLNPWWTCRCGSETQSHPVTVWSEIPQSDTINFAQVTIESENWIAVELQLKLSKSWPEPELWQPSCVVATELGEDLQFLNSVLS